MRKSKVSVCAFSGFYFYVCGRGPYFCVKVSDSESGRFLILSKKISLLFTFLIFLGGGGGGTRAAERDGGRGRRVGAFL